MKFELISNQEKALKRASGRNNRYEFHARKGSTICYQQPLYEQPFPLLLEAIYKGNTLSKLKSRYNKIESNGGYLHQCYPAVEYYKIAHRMIRDNTHTIRFSLDEINKAQRAIEDIYTTSKEKLPGGQTKLSFDKEMYQLRSSIFTFVFSVRATLDTVASLFQTIYGPQIGQHISFNGFMKYITGNNSHIKDPVMCEFIRTKMEWFILLKDIRDYLAHFGSINFLIKEVEPSVLSIELFKDIEINNFIETVDNGFQELLMFLDGHCSSIIDGG